MLTDWKKSLFFCLMFNWVLGTMPGTGMVVLNQTDNLTQKLRLGIGGGVV